MSATVLPPIQIAIADANPSDLAEIERMVQQDSGLHVVGRTTDVQDMLALLALEPDVVICAANLAPADPAALVKKIVETAPGAQVVLIHRATAGDSLDASLATLLERAVLAGARGILHKPVEARLLLSTIHQIMTVELARRERIREVPERPSEPRPTGQITLVFSPKGGTGCSVVAANLAVALRQVTGKRVALVDYSLQFGTLGTILDVSPLHTLAELVPHYHALDSTVIDNVLVAHPSGVQVLLAPARMDQIEAITTEALITILDALRTQFDYIVVDTWHAIESAILAVMERADNILLLATPEVPTLHAIRHFIDSLPAQPPLTGKLRLVINHYPLKTGVELKSIEQNLRMPVLATIPREEPGMTAAVNEGQPLVQLRPHSPAAQHLTQLATQLAAPADRVPAQSTPIPAHLSLLHWGHGHA